MTAGASFVHAHQEASGRPEIHVTGARSSATDAMSSAGAGGLPHQDLPRHPEATP